MNTIKHLQKVAEKLNAIQPSLAAEAKYVDDWPQLIVGGSLFPHWAVESHYGWNPDKKPKLLTSFLVGNAHKRRFVEKKDGLDYEEIARAILVALGPYLDLEEKSRRIMRNDRVAKRVKEKFTSSGLKCEVKPSDTSDGCVTVNLGCLELTEQQAYQLQALLDRLR